MPTIDPQAFALGFFTVIGLGLLAMYAGIHLRRVHTAQRITARWTAWNKANAAYLDAQLSDVPPRTDDCDLDYGTQLAAALGASVKHTCSFGPNCALRQQQDEDQARRAAL
jgi:hypothetical protein